MLVYRTSDPGHESTKTDIEEKEKEKKKSFYVEEL
jgi:hypothetical protein